MREVGLSGSRVNAVLIFSSFVNVFSSNSYYCIQFNYLSFLLCFFYLHSKLTSSEPLFFFAFVLWFIISNCSTADTPICFDSFHAMVLRKFAAARYQLVPMLTNAVQCNYRQLYGHTMKIYAVVPTQIAENLTLWALYQKCHLCNNYGPLIFQHNDFPVTRK